MPGDAGRIKSLAAHAEAELAGTPVSDEAICAEIAPCFRDEGARTDTVVLACTHYPLLIDRLRRLAPRPVAFVDSAPAIARRVNELLGPAPSPKRSGTTRAIFTSGRAPRTALARFGIRAHCLPRRSRLTELASLPFDRAADTLSFYLISPGREAVAMTAAGPKYAATNYGFLYIAQGVGSILGGPAAAFLKQTTGNWTAVFIIVAVLDALTALLAITALRTLRHRHFASQ